MYCAIYLSVYIYLLCYDICACFTSACVRLHDVCIVLHHLFIFCYADVAVLQMWTAVCGVVSIAWSLTSYHRSVRYARDDKEKVLWTGTIVAFCWHLTSAGTLTSTYYLYIIISK